MRSLVLLLGFFAGCGSQETVSEEAPPEVSQSIDTGSVCGRNGVTCGTVDCNDAATAKYCTECGAGNGAIDCCKIYMYCTIAPEGPRPK